MTRLKPAWTYHTGELEGRTGKTIECTPIVIDGVMYVTTGYLRVVALDAATGKELWQFDPLKDHPFEHQPASGGVNRGCAYWSDGKPGGERRIIHGTSDGRLFSLDAKTGKLDPKFGDGGVRNLRKELDPKVAALGYGPTSAPAVWKDTIIVGVSCGEGPGIAAPGDIRAFDVRTGEQVWRFRTVPRPGEFGHETWEGDSWKDRGGANAWGGLSVDADRGLVFAGLGSAAFDFYGGDRHGDNLFANCTIALDARTGKRVWHFQTLHHDLWDHDLPVYPNLVTVTRDGKPIDAVAQVTKTGYVFLFDRETGKPLFDVEEQPVPASDVPGEQASPTQPIPVKPPPFSAQFLDETNVTDIGEANRASVLARLRKIRGGPAFNPPSRQGTVVIPGFHGGANWSGASFDPTTGLLYVNSNNVPNIITLVESKAGDTPRYGPYRTHGLRPVPRPRGLPGDQAALGGLERDQPQHGRIRLAGPARRARGADRPRHPANRHRDVRRLDRDRRRPGVHRRHQGRTHPRLRQADRATALGTPPPGRRLRDPFDLSGERPPVRRHRRRRRRQAADEGGRCVRGVRAREEKVATHPISRSLHQSGHVVRRGPCSARVSDPAARATEGPKVWSTLLCFAGL